LLRVVRLKPLFLVMTFEMEVEVKKKRPILIVTNLLLIATVLIQIYIFLLRPSDATKIFETYSLSPFNLFRYYRIDNLITYMFLHGSLAHLIVNGIALYAAGSLVEREVGHLRYLMVFLVSGVIAGLAHCFLNPSSIVPIIGSSGAVFGVISVLFLLMPFKINFALIIPLPSVIVGIILSVVELSAFWMAQDVGIAHDAHLAGFITGGVCSFFIDRKRAVRGLLIAAIVLAVIYYLGVYFGLIPSQS